MIRITNPATEETVKELNADNATSISEKFYKAKRAQYQWAKTPLSHRLEIFRKFRGLLEKDKESLAKVLTLEMGKPLSQARGEVSGTLARLDFFIENTPTVLENETVLKDEKNQMTEMISHEPLGIIANISAWNYPYFVGTNVFAPALLAGNAVLYKPSEFASLTGLAIAEKLYQSGLPEDLFPVILGDGSVGAELLKQPIQGVFFTGSYATGAKIAQSVASRMIKVQLELGGKDPSYVCEDADIKSAAESTADGAFYNTGQSCCSVERIYVHEKSFDEFTAHFTKTVQGFTVGDPMDEKTYIAPLTRKAQLEFLEHQIKDAVSKGAKIVAGGKRITTRKGYYFEPTVLINVDHSMEVMREESFGPLIGIQKVKDDAEALKLMNDTAYGLTAGIYTKNKSRAETLLSQVNAGSAYWNCCDRVSPRLPWSGRGHSGMGLTLSTYGILAFTQPKAWHLRG